MTKKVRKAVLPVAGLGTRFLPATKAIPKEMLPLVDTPSIQLIVEECVAAGIEEIIFVTARGKSAIEDHFDRAGELESPARDAAASRTTWRACAARRRWPATCRCARRRRKGLGHAVLCAREAVGDEPFAVVLGDDLLDAEVSGVRQLIDVYEKTGTGVIALKEVPAGQEHMYGIVDGEPAGPRQMKIRQAGREAGAGDRAVAHGDHRPLPAAARDLPDPRRRRSRARAARSS